MTSTLLRRGLYSLLVSTAFCACGGSGETGTGGEGGQGATGSGGDAGSFITGGGGQSTGPTIDENSACATSAVEGESLPVTMLIMFDKSASMLEDQKWAGAKAALIAFFQDDESAGLSVGLRFFPDDSPAAGCNDQACSIDACSQPLVLPGPLTTAPADSDPQQKALVDAVNSKTPAGQTPMYAALGGAELWATQNAQSGSKNTVVVLVTDGEPTTCNTDVAQIAALAKDAFINAGVRTYAIGMVGSNQTQLDQIASAGGTDKALLANAGSVAAKLGEALASIQKAQIACTFDVPEASNPDEPVDPGKVNVNYHDGSGKVVTMPKVSGIDACGGTYGWYYDDSQNPQSILLCPGTCAEIQNNPNALVKILLGCETIAK
ncbi:MAG: VWA domain-containing protein [Polyangiaceae bacterium]|nr:VWA domain-containing protein [Polyangiaceae bacterium]